MKITPILTAAIILLDAAATTHLLAQTPAASANPSGAAGRGQGRGGGLGGAYNPRPPADAAQVERGKGLYSVNCTFCHGVDARGGEGGPNLLRSQLVLDDIKGELIATVVQVGRTDRGMPKFDFMLDQVADIAAFIHSINGGSHDASRNAPPSIVTGDAKAGEVYFHAKCANCHSTTGDLKGIAARISDPKTLQQNWLMPGGGGFGASPVPTTVRSKTATVTLASGEKVEGGLARIDDFAITLSLADGTARTFIRKGNTPKVEVHDPLSPHKQLLTQYTDKDIHDVTAYLVKIK